MSTSKPVILLLSGGSLVGVNVLATLEHYRSHFKLVCTNSTSDDPAIYSYDQVHLTPPTENGSAAYLEALNNIVRIHQPILIIPCRDEDILALALYRETLPHEQRDICLCGNPETASVLLDKYRSYQFSKKHELPFAETLLIPESAEAAPQFAASYGYPLIAKPREGFASKGVRFILNELQLKTLIENHSLIIQSYIGNKECLTAYSADIVKNGVPLFHSFEEIKHSMQTLIHRDGSFSPIFLSCNKMRYGKSEQVWIEKDEELETIGKHCAEAFSKAGWRGPLNIQCARDDAGNIGIYEYNGRFTGATSARYLLGYNEVSTCLQSWIDQALPEVATPPKGDLVTRIPQSYCCPEHHLQRLRESGVWES